ncbi:insulinase family protein [Limisphaera ngatamarikiensis]|uniref:Insulinase family protein n=1 Tax=Limisphaera ngatamarikiensis TaxID=1324935 RepID=A0A6M1RR30_9BACT|nr:pitrilysin family protein [Limisphaera ngatamarikiensis]NGO39999.1 insulinase family protein [Limisphaera ngatamarikiensis]
MPRVATPASQPAAEWTHVPPDVHLTHLENGLVIIVRQDRSAPVVSAQAWCMSGSVHEGRWLGAGLSHLLEHMLFKGTRTRPASRIDQEVQEAGGYINAYTSFDRTVFYIDVPSTGARVAVDILCDIMQNATLPADELAKEQDVIRREMDMCHDDPHRRSSQRLFEVAYTRSPLRYTVIGYPDLFNAVRREDVVAYYREKYVPNNIFYVVVGDVDPEAVVRQIRDAYAQTPARPLPPEVLPEEPRQTAPREILEETTTELGHLHIAWHIPDARHPDLPALEVLATILGQGRSSRLFQQVREKLRLVTSVDAWTYTTSLPGLFGISAIMEPDRLHAARQALLDEVRRLQDRLIPEAELQKAIKQCTTALLSSRKTMAGQAQDLGGCWLLASDLAFSQRYLEAIRRLTPEQLREVARTYLVPENRTLYGLWPKGRLPQNPRVAAAHVSRPIQKIELPGGLRLLVKEDHRLPFVEIRAVFRGGVLAETPETNGLTALTARLLLKGTKRRSGEAVARTIESVGGYLDSYGGNNSFGLSAEVLHEDLDLGLELLAEILQQPAFPVSALEHEREVLLTKLRARKDDLLTRAFLAMRRAMFGTRGYGLDTLGNETSLPALDVEAVRTFHHRWTVPRNCVLALFGHVQADAAAAAVQKWLNRWNGTSQPPSLSGPEPRCPDRPERVRETHDKRQAVLVMGWPGVRLDSPDRFALEVIEELCSDLGSRLFLRVREKLGLAYYVGAQNFMGLAPGYFAFYAGTEPSKVARVEKEFREEARILQTRGVTAAELQRAKSKLLGQKKIARQELGSLAQQTALDELYGLGYENFDAEDARIEAVTLEDIRSVANRYLNPDRYILAVVEPESGRRSRGRGT